MGLKVHEDGRRDVGSIAPVLSARARSLAHKANPPLFAPMTIKENDCRNHSINFQRWPSKPAEMMASRMIAFVA